MSWVGFESTIPAFEQAKTFHALDLAAAVICSFFSMQYTKYEQISSEASYNPVFCLKHFIKGYKIFPCVYFSHEDVWGSGSIASRMLNLGNTHRRVASLTPRQLYPRG
jgi:hypothetical protein